MGIGSFNLVRAVETLQWYSRPPKNVFLLNLVMFLWMQFILWTTIYTVYELLLQICMHVCCRLWRGKKAAEINFSLPFWYQMLSLLPSRVLRLMEFLGFSGDRVGAISLLTKTKLVSLFSTTNNMRIVFLVSRFPFKSYSFANDLAGSGFVIAERGSSQQQPALHPQHPDAAHVSSLHYSDSGWEDADKCLSRNLNPMPSLVCQHFLFFSIGDQECLILCSHILPSGTGDGNLTEAETLLQPYTEKFPNVSCVFFLPDMILMKCHTCLLLSALLWIELFVRCPYRELWCSSTPQGLLCSKETSPLWVFTVNAISAYEFSVEVIENWNPCVSLCRPRRSSWLVSQHSRSGVRFTTCVTGSWCGPTPSS